MDSKKDDTRTSSDIVFFGDPYGTPPMAAIETFGGEPPNGQDA
jgi:hypothetical protein